LRVSELKRISIKFRDRPLWFTGVINRISSDTLCMLDTCFNIGIIESIQFGNRMLSDMGKKWEVIIPPDKIYVSYPERSRYLHDLDRETGREFKTAKRKEVQNIPYNEILKINATRLFHFELALAYEHIFHKKAAFEIELGYEVAAAGMYLMDNKTPVNAFSGPSLLLGFKFYDKKRFYLGPEIHLKYLEMMQHSSQYPTPRGVAAMQDQFKAVYGISLRGGMIRNLKGCIVDIYAGLGVKYEKGYQVAYYYFPSPSDDSHLYFNPERTPVTGNFTAWYPIVNIGIKLGFGF